MILMAEKSNLLYMTHPFFYGLLANSRILLILQKITTNVSEC